MSNRNQDPIDNIIVQFGWALATAIIAFGFGWMRGNDQKEKDKAKQLQFPDSLEIDYSLGVSFLKPHKKVARWRLIGFVIYVGLALITALAGSGFLNPIGWVVTFIAGGYLYYKWHQDQEYTQREALFAHACQAAPLNRTSAKCYTITIPRTIQWDTGTAKRFMANLLEKLGGKATFQIVADAKSITWRVIDLRYQLEPQIIIQTIQAFYPSAEIYVADLEDTSYTEPCYRYTMRYGQLNPIGSIQGIEQLKNFDPLATLTAEFNTLQAGERVSYTLFVTEVAQFLYDQADDWLTVEDGITPLQFLSAEGWVDAGYKMTTRERQRFNRFTPEDQTMVEDKLHNVCHQALLVVQIEASSLDRIKDLILVQSHLSQYDNFPANALRWQEEDITQATVYVDNEAAAHRSNIITEFERWLTNENLSWKPHRLILNMPELAALWHLPHADFVADKLIWSEEEIAPLPKELQSKTEGLKLGTAYAKRAEYHVYMLPKDRATHMIVTGAIGMGKSTFLHRLIQQDIARGDGVAVIDPKGNLIEDILRASIPEERRKDVILWDLADTQNPPPLNVLLKSSGVVREDAAATLMAVFQKVYGTDFAYARMGQTLVYALQAVMGSETPTLRDISRLFRDDDYRDQLLATLDNPVAEEFWLRFDQMSERARQEQVEPVLRRIEMLYGDKLLYPIFCQPNTLQLRKWMEEKKIILISLNPPSNYTLSRDKQSLLGSILVSEFQLAVASQDLPEPFFLYADEAHQFVASSLDEVFIKARQRQLSMTLATQYPKQFGLAFDAIMETVGATVAFACEDGTANILKKRMRPEFSEHDLINLAVHDASVRMRYDDEQMRPFLLKTEDVEVPLGKIVEKRVNEIRELSQQQYTPYSATEIYQWLETQYARTRDEDTEQPDPDGNGDSPGFYDTFSVDGDKQEPVQPQ